MKAIEVYLDESGTHAGSKVLCVAGYLFEREAAQALTAEWQQWLEFYGLPHFHMTDCAQGARHFKGWTNLRRNKAKWKFIRLINRFAWTGFAATLIPSEYSDFPEELYPLPRMGPYSLCLHSCIANVATHWVTNTGYTGEISYFFESGHDDQAEANRLMRILAEDPKSRAALRYGSHQFVGKTAAIPVQAADLLAWQWYTDRKRQLEGLPRRKDCEALLATNRVLTTHLSVDHFWQRLQEHPVAGPLLRSGA
ncbi:DUF3800 domain-containing protein [Bradyrhizobium sp. CCBAU 11361]|uniref:DUF3800 domain-containing protein n=1 Tax=Bradyrhizobium sp. CCBAU 11361 TaxID=1630812 RepID=UPI002303D1C4|nr:DUF3800 domain-containing protein [Bradyrhizobium sp. CCBAU 11361]